MSPDRSINAALFALGAVGVLAGLYTDNWLMIVAAGIMLFGGYLGMIGAYRRQSQSTDEEAEQTDEETQLGGLTAEETVNGLTSCVRHVGEHTATKQASDDKTEGER